MLRHNMVDINRHVSHHNLVTLFFWVILVSVYVLPFLYGNVFLLHPSSYILKGLQHCNIV